MQIRATFVAALAVALLGLCAAGHAQEEPKKDKQELKLKGVQCLFCKMDVQEEAFVEYKGARVFFGCAGCPEAFKQEPKKFAAKANAQLVATNQARQTACPLSARPVKKDIKLTVAKTEVAFCCPNCKAATAKLEGEEQLEKVFSDVAFKKGFKVRKPKKKT